MSTLLKTLNEQRGAKLKQAQEITQKLEAEKRGFTDDERAAIRGINDEVDKINGDIEQEVRTIANLSKSAPQLSRGEDRDIASFNLGKVMVHLDRVSRGLPSTLDGVELEMAQEGEREIRSVGLGVSGFALPRLLLERRADLSVTGGTTTQYGGKLVQTDKGRAIGDFYNSSVLEQNGALVFRNLTGNLEIPVYSAGTAPLKKTENEAAGDVAGTFGSVTLAPKRLPGFVVFSDQLLMQSAENIEAFISNQVLLAMAAVKEAAFFHGTGTSEAAGIAGKSGIGSVVGGTNGAAPTYTHMVNLYKEVAIDNALTGNVGYFTNSAVVSKLLRTAKVSSTDSQMVLNNLSDGFLGFPVNVTNAISSTLSKGSASGTASAIFYGNAADYAVGYWGGIMLEIERDADLAKKGQRMLVASTYYDGALLRAKSFSAMLDALPA